MRKKIAVFRAKSGKDKRSGKFSSPSAWERNATKVTVVRAKVARDRVTGRFVSARVRTRNTAKIVNAQSVSPVTHRKYRVETEITPRRDSGFRQYEDYQRIIDIQPKGSFKRSITKSKLRTLEEKSGYIVHFEPDFVFIFDTNNNQKIVKINSEKEGLTNPVYTIYSVADTHPAPPIKRERDDNDREN